MNEKEVDRYIIASKTVSIPDVQKRFGLGYKEVHTYFQKLIAEEKIFLKDELYYGLCERMNQIPPVYLKALWDCIKRDDVDFDYIKAKYDLSTPTVKIMLEWMKDNGFIEDTPFLEVLLTKEEFIERFGSIEEEINKDEKEETSIFKDDLGDLRAALAVRRAEILNRIHAFEKEEEVKEDIKEEDVVFLEDIDIKSDECSLDLTLLEDETIKEKMKFIVKLNPKISLQEFISYVEKKHLNAVVNVPKEIEIYEKIIEVIHQFEEEDFLNLKEILLKEVS